MGRWVIAGGDAEDPDCNLSTNTRPSHLRDHRRYKVRPDAAFFECGAVTSIPLVTITHSLIYLISQDLLLINSLHTTDPN
jgi:hypothetical protein